MLFIVAVLRVKSAFELVVPGRYLVFCRAWTAAVACESYTARVDSERTQLLRSLNTLAQTAENMYSSAIALYEGISSPSLLQRETTPTPIRVINDSSGMDTTSPPHGPDLPPLRSRMMLPLASLVWFHAHASCTGGR